MTLRLEHRKSRRRRVLKGGRIFYNNYCFSCDCIIRNENDSGMQLKVDSGALVPTEFAILNRKDGTLANARMVWHKDTQIGIEFLSKFADVRDSSREHIRQMSVLVTSG